MPPKTLKVESLGQTRLRLVRYEDGRLGGRYDRLSGGDVLYGDPGETEHEFWRRLTVTALRDDPSFFGYDGAIARFLDIFPDGFEDAGYLEKERNYKVQAREKLNETVPVAAAASRTGYVEGVVEAFKNTNLIHPRWERPPLITAMHSEDGDLLIKHLANFALGDRNRLSTIAVICKRHDICYWPIVTYLPFLWETDNENAILRYEPTNKFAVKVGHPFSEMYESNLNPAVYDSLLDLFVRTRDEIANLNPRDMIDVQSFVWVVSKYD